LPHGYEGQGPEHSSARLERYLQLCAEDNMQVANLTTPAQYFHILRRQMKRNFRKPLVIMTPKSLLRHKGAVSSVQEFTSEHFREILDDNTADPAKVNRVLLCSGKVYYDLLEERNRKEIQDAALIRVEQLYPLNESMLRGILAKYKKADLVGWVQEESQNMGAWSFIEPRLRGLGIDIKYVGRDASASPATGSKKVHEKEQKELVETALTGNLPHLVKAPGARGGYDAPTAPPAYTPPVREKVAVSSVG
jgi:2-oxoglutarate dehydrogenase E1 component